MDPTPPSGGGQETNDQGSNYFDSAEARTNNAPTTGAPSQMPCTDLSRRSLKGEGGCESSAFALTRYGGQVALIQDELSIKDIMKAQGIADFRAPPPIPKFIDTAQAIDELPEYDSFEPAPDDF